jgi:hypothetical protein
MMRRFLRLALPLCVASAFAACGARSDLDDPAAKAGGGAAGGEGGQGGDGSGATAGGGNGGEGGMIPCQPGETLVCGLDVGECSTGVSVCDGEFFGPCLGSIDPVEEACNDLDDDCNGEIDNGFNLGSACDGVDSDLCSDDVMTCGGCTLGDDDLEVCNGFDDNCNGTIDADCDIGDCQPDLLVTGSTPSSPNCVDFPVEAGSTGSIQYPCGGGEVSATLSGIDFTGDVVNGEVFLAGTQQIIGPDGCLWRLDHTISGVIASGELTYFYEETLLSPPQGCWLPCTEVGDVEVEWEK